MNPACRQNMESRECQEWMNLVSSHCRPLLPNAEQALLWDRWWPDDLTAPYKTWVSTMSAFDCHRLRKVVARQVAAQVEGGLPAEGHDHPVMWSVYRWIVVLVVLLTVVMAMAFAVRILIGSARGWRPAECTPTPPPTPRIVEAPPPPSMWRLRPASLLRSPGPLSPLASTRIRAPATVRTSTNPCWRPTPCRTAHRGKSERLRLPRPKSALYG